MKIRIISALVAIAIGAFAVLQFNSIILNLFALLVFAISSYEIHHAFKEGNSKYVIPLLIYEGFIVLLYPYLKINIMLALSVFVLLFASIVVFNFKKIEFKAIAATVAFGLYILFGLYSIVRIKIVMPYEQFGWDAAFLFTMSGAIAWGGDTMAYFGGYFFGKHKLAPVLSPKKTIEGAVGGVIGSVLCTLLITYIYSIIKPMAEGTGIVYSVSLNKYIVISCIAAIGSLVGMIGDLFASAIKRQSGVKDYGHIMPGHGGLIDRFDSILLVAPFISAIANVLSISGGVL